MELNIAKKKYKVNWVPSIIVLLAVCIACYFGFATLAKMKKEKAAIAELVHTQGPPGPRGEQGPTGPSQQFNSNQLMQPYEEYKVDGDIIREYKLFPEMDPKEKDHADRLNYFHRQDFLNLCEKYQLDDFPTKWTTNKENLGNFEYNQDGKTKKNTIGQFLKLIITLFSLINPLILLMIWSTIVKIKMVFIIILIVF